MKQPIAWTATSAKGRVGLGQAQASGLDPARLRALVAAAFVAVAEGGGSHPELEGRLRNELERLMPSSATLDFVSLETLGVTSTGTSCKSKLVTFAVASAFSLILAIGWVVAWRDRATEPPEEVKTSAAFEQHYREGLEYMARGAHEDAARALTAALKANPEHARARAARARAFYMRGEFVQARQDLAQALGAFPADASADERLDLQTLQSETALLSKDARGALELAKAVMQRRPHEPEVLWHAARACLELGEEADALRYLNDVVAQKPENHAARYKRGYTRHLLGDFEGAISDYEAILRFLPKHGLAKRYLKAAEEGEKPKR